MFDAAKDRWAALSQFGAWLAGIVLLFVAVPARLRLNEDPSWAVRFVQFALTIIVGVIVVAFWRRCAPRYRRRWLIACIVSFILGLAAFGAYLHLSNRWTCSYLGLPPVVIGKTYTADAAPVAVTVGNSCTRLLREYGENWEIWDENEIEDRYLLLIAIFSLVVIAFALAVVFLVQAWRCGDGRGADPLAAPRERPARRGSSPGKTQSAGPPPGDARGG